MQLIWLAATDDPDEPVYLTNLQLQKLLYFVQGWAMAERGAALFTEPLEAWREGPVVRSVWEAFKNRGKQPILDVPAAPPGLTPPDAEVVRAVWDAYKGYSAIVLRDISHDPEGPWQRARGTLDAGDASRRPLDLTGMAQYFTQQIEFAQRRLRVRLPQLADRALHRRSQFGLPAH